LISSLKYGEILKEIRICPQKNERKEEVFALFFVIWLAFQGRKSLFLSLFRRGESFFLFSTE